MTNKRTVEEVLKAADIDTVEHDFIIECLKEAVNYCHEQYHDSGIDWLPTASKVGLSEDDKFKLLKKFLNNL